MQNNTLMHREGLIKGLRVSELLPMKQVIGENSEHAQAYPINS